MRHNYILSFVLLCFISLIGRVLFAQNVIENTHKTISYQGMVTSVATGEAITGMMPITATLFADEEGTEQVWQGSYNTQVNKGIFQLQLGAGSYPLPDAKSLDRPLWVGIRFGETETMKPLTPLSAAPYALTVADHSITSSKMATDYVSGVTVDGKKISSRGTYLNLKSGPGVIMNYDEQTNSLTVGSGGTGKQDPQWIGNQPCPNDLNNDGNVADNTIPGGCGNTTTNGPTYAYASILGGYHNQSINDYTAVGGGNQNVASGLEATVGGGIMNTASGEQSAIIGGDNNAATGVEATVGGGHQNTAAGNQSFVGGGDANIAPAGIAPGIFAANTVGGGFHNNAGGNYSTVGGGYTNTNTFIVLPQPGPPFIPGALLQPDYAFIGGGYGNVITDNYGTIGGGQENWAGNDRNNLPLPGFPAPPVPAVVVDAMRATVGGGWFNSALAGESSILGGEDNVTGAVRASIIGGAQNLAYGPASVIGGGEDNEININIILPRITGPGAYPPNTSKYSTIGGGYKNLIDHSDFAFIGAGNTNTIDNVSPWSTIGGGEMNYITGGAASAIPGGRYLKLGANSFGFNADNTPPPGVQATDLTVNGYTNVAYFGNADVWIGNVDGNPRELRFFEGNADHNYGAGNSEYTGFKAPVVLPSSFIYTLPSVYPATAKEFLVSDNTGILSWTTDLTSLFLPFSNLTGGTLTSQQLIVGSNASISFSGNGTIQSNIFSYDVNGTDAVDLNSEVSNILPNANGGTGISSYTSGDILYANNTPVLATLPIGMTGQILSVSSGGLPQWSNPASMSFTNIASGTNTIATMTLGNGASILLSGGTVEASKFKGSGSTSDAVDLATNEVGGTLGASNGGTGYSFYTVGDLLYASATNALSSLPIGTNGQVLSVLNGVPSWVSPSVQSSVAFTNVTSGTNTSATMTVGSGASIVPGGTGSVTATKFTGSGSTSNAVDLASAEVNGTLGVTNGGTGIATATTGDMLYASASNTYSRLAVGTNTQILTVSGGVPTWQNPPASSSVAFSNITTATNTGATMSVGTGASIVPSGSGSITATNFTGSGSTSNAVDLATGEVSGTLGTANGGTGLSTVGSNGQVLTVVSGAPAWQSVSSIGWLLSGNSGTNPPTDFIGTTDNKPLVFKTNGGERMRIDPQGYLGIGTTNPAVSLDVNGGIALHGWQYNITSDNPTVVVSNHCFLKLSSNYYPTYRTITLSNGSYDGQIIIMMGNSSTSYYGVEVDAYNSNIKLKGTRYLYKYSVLTLIWDSGTSKWVEMSWSQ